MMQSTIHCKISSLKQKYYIKWYHIQHWVLLGRRHEISSLSLGVDSATTYSCIWCKCPANQRCDMQLVWSITETEYDARTVDEISKMSKLGKYSKKWYNCSHEPIFDFIPIHHVIIDILHLFLRISDVLRAADKRHSNFGKRKTSHTSPSTNNFKWLQSSFQVLYRQSQKMKWRDLTCPEKKHLFEKINILNLFPSLEKGQAIQTLWND